MPNQLRFGNSSVPDSIHVTTSRGIHATSPSRCAVVKHARSGVVEVHGRKIALSRCRSTLKRDGRHPKSIPGRPSHHSIHIWSQKSMADVASCSFGKNRVPDNFFLSYFSTAFPLPQQHSWKHVHLTIDMTLLMTLMLHGARLTLQQWMTSYKPKTGTTGWDYPHTRNNILTCRTAPSPSIITSSSVFLRGTGRDTTVGAVMWHKSLSC